MNTCASCGAENTPDARFCAFCGASFEATCTSCRATLPATARFCSSCGAPVQDEAPAAHVEERRVVTLLFADIVDSTVLGERLDPEHLREVLDHYFAAMREELEAEGGTVEKFIGDAVVAAFGTPIAHEDDAVRALRAALRMHRRLPELNGALEASHGVRLAIRIGVNTGEVLATVDPMLGEATFTGDAVNTAARFQSLADAGQILASERTVNAARGFRVKDLGVRAMKGKAEPVRTFEVLDEDEHAPLRGVPGLSAPMVGRDAELALLMSFLTRVNVEHRPHLVTIYGEPGVGKSRLTQEFLLAAEDEGRHVIRGRCLPYGDGVTYWPLAEILKSVAGVSDTDAPDVAIGRVKDTGRSLLGEDEASIRATAALAFTMGLEDPQVPIGDLDPALIRQEIGAAWLAFFDALGQAGDVLAVIEDIHWGDPALLDLLEELAERLEAPVLFLCPARPELLAHRPTWGGGKRNYSALSLDPLTEGESEDLVRALLDIGDLPPSVHRQILERAGGNPFFLEEIVRQLVDGGLVVRDGERWRATGEVAGVVIPDTVQAVLAARIDLLDPAPRRVLQAAAVVGRQFWPGVLERLVSDDAASIIDAFGPLLERDLIRVRPASAFAGQIEYSFKHVLTRDVAYDTLPRRERAIAHAAVATWLETAVGERRGEFVDLLAYHTVEAHRAGRESVAADLDLATLRRSGYELSLQAAEGARVRQALTRSVRYCRQALDLAEDAAERSVAAQALAQAYFDGYVGDEAWDAWTMAIREGLAAPEVDRERIARLVADAVALPTRWVGSMHNVPREEEVRRILEIGMDHLPPGDSPQRVSLLGLRASWPFAFPSLSFTPQEIDELVAVGVEAADTALRLGLPDLASSSLDAAAGPLLSDGRYADVFVIELRRFGLVEQLKDPLERGDAYAMMAWCSAGTGHWTEALRYAREGYDVSRTSSPNTAVHLLAWLVDVHFHLGDWDGALAAFNELVNVLDDRRNDPPNFASSPFASAARIHLHRGERAEAASLNDVLQRRAAQSTADTLPIRPWTAQIPVLVGFGLLEEAEARLRDPLPGWRISAFPLFEGEAAWIEATAAWDRAEEAAARMRAFGDARGCRPIVWRAGLLEARWLWATGNVDAGLAAARAARAGYADGGMAFEVALCDLEIAAAVGLASLEAEDKVRLEEATSLFEQLRSVAELGRVRNLS